VQGCRATSCSVAGHEAMLLLDQRAAPAGGLGPYQAGYPGGMVCVHITFLPCGLHSMASPQGADMHRGPPTKKAVAWPSDTHDTRVGGACMDPHSDLDGLPIMPDHFTDHVNHRPAGSK
jgi:hypothetical protein